MPKIINLLSGPSSGKSTLAAELFVFLKKQNKNVEYLQEYAKKLVWTKKFDILNNQHLVTYKFYESIKAMADVSEIEYIILDSSLLNGLWYNRNNLDNLSNIEKTEKLIMQYFSEFNNVNFFVNRSANQTYNTNGRIESEAQALSIDAGIKHILKHHNIQYHDIYVGGNGSNKGNGSNDPVHDIVSVLNEAPQPL